MSKIIDKHLSENNHISAIKECIKENKPNLALLLSEICIHKGLHISPELYRIYSTLTEPIKEPIKNPTQELLPRPEIPVPKIRVLMYCNWCSSEDLCQVWKKMSKDGNGVWNGIEIVSEMPSDYYCVINCPPFHISPDPTKTIVFRMEPNMDDNRIMWGDWSNPGKEFVWVGYHKLHYNNLEWHLSKTYSQLSSERIEKKFDILSTVLSEKYRDPGHIKRVDFVKYLETKGLDVDVFGSNKFGWKSYKGSLPYHTKDDAILPYKYTFNAENYSQWGYFTEKLVDGILGETLTFYWGCPNVGFYIDPRAYIQLDLVNFEEDCQTIITAIKEDWWSQRIEFIRVAKQKILNEMQFFPRLEKIIAKHREK